MRIDSTTKSYIKRLVAEKASAKLNKLKDTKASLAAEEENEYEKAIKKFNEKKIQVEKSFVEQLTKLRDSIGLEPFHDYAGEIHEIEVSFYNLYDSGMAKFREKIRKTSDEISALERAIEMKYEEIVAKLSLGGTMKDLEELLKNIKF